MHFKISYSVNAIVSKMFLWNFVVVSMLHDQYCIVSQLLPSRLEL